MLADTVRLHHKLKSEEMYANQQSMKPEAGLMYDLWH